MHVLRRAGNSQTLDYTSRRVKWRLFAGLAVVMLVLSVIERATYPDFRRWLSTGGVVERTESFDNKLSVPAWRTSGDPLGTFVAAASGPSEIRDDTPVFRPAEQEDWFSAVSRVQGEATPAATRVAYLQLYNQPADYRGKFVTVKGTARMAYRVPALENALGVKEYFVYWIHPVGGPDSPILVYALTAPEGFPIAESLSEAGRRQKKMHEDVEVTGVFLKRAAYAGQGGTYTAPLIVANSPIWLRADEAPARLPLSPLELGIAAIISLVFSVCLTAVLWKRSRRPRVDPNSGGFPDLGPITLGPTARERLLELENQAQREGNV